ncbi:MAG: N-acetylglucosamine-6-phosphate deacetylase [Planctomycetes bacterium]|nr:N-acetylglucosamine-6-phosphate deacetylase [Planctomycetota bacterium]
MAATLLQPDAVVLPHTIAHGAQVLVEQGRITAVGYGPFHAERTVRVVGHLLPGFIDLQVNGAGGRSVDEATPEALDATARAVLAGGAVAFLPTLITAPLPLLCQQITRIVRWLESPAPGGARPLGLHLEGPFLESSGVHDAALFVDPTPERLRAILDAARGHLRLVTLAPGRPGAPEAVRILREAGVAVGFGHGESTQHFDECAAAGASLVTHLFNAMGPLHHRKPGISGHALDDQRLSCTLIVDGAHVHPAMVRNAFRCLGVDRTLLVTDCVSAAGMPDGEYLLAGMTVRLQAGVVRDGQGRLAGSALTMGLAARNFLDMVPAAGPWTLARIAATNPARAVGAQDLGAIDVGKRAEFSVLRGDQIETLRC